MMEYLNNSMIRSLIYKYIIYDDPSFLQSILKQNDQIRAAENWSIVSLHQKAAAD